MSLLSVRFHQSYFRQGRLLGPLADRESLRAAECMLRIQSPLRFLKSISKRLLWPEVGVGEAVAMLARCRISKSLGKWAGGHRRLD